MKKERKLPKPGFCLLSAVVWALMAVVWAHEAAVWQNACYPGMAEPRRLGLLGTCRGCWDRPEAPPIG